MAYVYDSARGVAVPIHIAIRECIAGETNTRTVMQRRGLADGLRIQHLCTRFANMVRARVEIICKFGWVKWNEIATPSLVALERRLRTEIMMWQEEHRLHIAVLMTEDVFEIQSRPLLWRDRPDPLRQYRAPPAASCRTLVDVVKYQLLSAADARTRRCAAEHPARWLRVTGGDGDVDRRWALDFGASHAVRRRFANVDALTAAQGATTTRLAQLSVPCSTDIHAECARLAARTQLVMRSSALFTHRCHVSVREPSAPVFDAIATRAALRALPHPSSLGAGLDASGYHAAFRAEPASSYHRYQNLVPPGGLAVPVARSNELPLWDCWSIVKTATTKRKTTSKQQMQAAGGDPRSWVAAAICYRAGTAVRLHRQLTQGRLAAQRRLFWLRHVQPRRAEAALLLQRIGRGSIARAVLRVPMTAIIRRRAFAVILRAMRRWVAIARAKRERYRLSYARAWGRSLAASVDRGMALRIFVAVLQQFARAAIATRLRAMLHVVHRVEADARRRRFYTTSSARLRTRVKRTKRDWDIQRRERLELERYAATRIQRFVRGVLTRLRIARGPGLQRAQRRAEQERQELRGWCAGVIQGAWRRWWARARAAGGLRRVAELRRRVAEYLQLEKYSATVIQRNWRRYAAVCQLRLELARAKDTLARLKRERLERLSRRFEGTGPNPFGRLLGLRAEVEAAGDDSFKERSSAAARLFTTTSSAAPATATAHHDASGSSAHTSRRNSPERRAGSGHAPTAAEIRVESDRADAALGRKASNRPVVPSAFAWLRGLPHAQTQNASGAAGAAAAASSSAANDNGGRPSSASTAAMRAVDEKEEMLRQRRLRQKRAAALNRQVAGQMAVIAADPLAVARRTRELLLQQQQQDGGSSVSAMDLIGKNRQSSDAPPNAAAAAQASDADLPHMMMMAPEADSPAPRGEREALAGRNKKVASPSAVPAAKRPASATAASASAASLSLSAHHHPQSQPRFVDTRRALTFE